MSEMFQKMSKLRRVSCVVLIVLQKNWDEDVQSFVPFDERLQSKTCLTREVRSVSHVHLEPWSLTLRPKSMIRKKTEVKDSLLDYIGCVCFKKECGNTSICNRQ